MSEERGLILGKNGTPFPNEKAASATMREKGLDQERYVVVRHLGGLAIVDSQQIPDANIPDVLALRADGKHFGSAKEAEDTAEKRELDPTRYTLVKRLEGYALLDKQSVSHLYNPATPDVGTPAARRKLKYVRIMVDERGEGSTEPEVVSVGLVNLGATLQLRRGEEVVIPEPMLEVLNNTRHARYSHNQGEGRKIVSYSRRYGYRVLGEATRADYEHFVTRGRAAVAEAKVQPSPPMQAVMAAGVS